MVEKLKAAMEEDFDGRMAWFPGNPDPALFSPSVTQFKKDGIVYDDGKSSVEAFKVEHAGWEFAFAYKVTTPEVGAFANVARPGLLVLYHVLPGTAATLANTLAEVQSVYSGPTVMGKDLDVLTY